jgi:Flp pilus assembly protein TadG
MFIRVIGTLRDEKGEAAVESAMVFPLVVLAVITLIYISAFLFDQTTGTARIHLAVAKDAGTAAGNYYTSAKKADGVSTSIYGGSTRICSGEKGISIEKRGLLSSAFSRNARGRFYLIDEKSKIRIKRFLKGSEKGPGE